MKFIIATILILVALTVLFGWIAYTRSVDLGDKVATVIIMPGDNLGTVTDKLLAEGVIDSRVMIKYPARILGVDKKLTPGRYDFTGRTSCRSVLAKLEAADFVNIKLTIPEGATIWKVASILAERMELDSASVVALNNDSAYLAQHGLPGLEGFLFPETYFLPWGTGAREIVDEMLRMYQRQTEGIWPDTLDSLQTRYKVLKIASIIEAETGRIDERTMVSSVYYNRLRKGMKLDADPTVIYGLGGLDRPLWHKDLRRDTPYNTYMRKGLPPTPINSPGLASIKAAISPAASDYFYFVADENGGHRFSRTNAEHNRAIREIRSSN
ncbi:MAG: endolytic transglycosylase MltG [candidate division Zixibacteria bacterium]|nr:endolytic transglycosylase MltG [candidate division Zixibacteria bacterium]